MHVAKQMEAKFGRDAQSKKSQKLKKITQKAKTHLAPREYTPHFRLNMYIDIILSNKKNNYKERKHKNQEPLTGIRNKQEGIWAPIKRKGRREI